MKDSIEYLDGLLKKLCQASGTGYSGNVAEVLIDEMQSFVSDARVLEDGSVYGMVPGSGDLHLMLACHLDEIGFLVSYVEDNGFIRIRQIGGCDERILPGQEVEILSRKPLKGYVGAKPPHLMTKEEQTKVLSIDNLFIDTGLKPEVVKKLVKIGDIVCFAGSYNKLQGDFRSAKSLDNRASVACAVMIMREIAERSSPVNIHFVATNQEEFSGLGARIHSYRLKLDYGVVIDVTHGEFPGIAETECFGLNKGPVIARGATIPKKLYQILIDAAKSQEIPYQIEPLPGYTGTDADTIAFNKQGIPTCVLGIPLRYMHTPVEVVCLKDIERTARLVIEFIKRL
ncbi:MAG: M20/M25/M40 family metallo-hydrolase [candidate division WOR-3 bacterium]